MSHNIFKKCVYSYLKPMWHNITEPSLVPMTAEGVLDERFGGGFQIHLRPVTGFTKAADKLVKQAAGSTQTPAAEILRRVQDGLAQEIKLMLDEGVVPEVEDIDLCLILGAGWPFIDGGASPYLDREGASQRAFGGSFHEPMIRGIANR